MPTRTWKFTASCRRVTSKPRRRTNIRSATAVRGRTITTTSGLISLDVSRLVSGSVSSSSPKTVEWAYGDYRHKDWLGVRVGKVKIPLGLYNESRDNDALRNPILLPQGLYSDYFRDVTNSILGAGIYGTGPYTPMGKFAYQFYVGTLPLNNDSALAGALQASSMTSGPTYSYGLEWQPPVDGLRVAVTGLSTEWSTTFGNPAATTTLTIEPFQRQFFSVEYVRNNLTQNTKYGLEDLDFDWSFAPSIEKRRGDSWYVGSAYRFTDWMELGAYYNEYYVDRNHRDGSSHNSFNGFPNEFNMYQKDLAVTVRFDPMRNVEVKLEGHLLQGTALNWLDFTPADMVKDWTLFVFLVSFFFLVLFFVACPVFRAF